jgi:glycosyltransferase involved in cell wall biosynthesis
MVTFIFILFVTVLVLVGMLGLLMMTVLFPLLACMASRHAVRREPIAKHATNSACYTTANQSAPIPDKPEDSQIIKLHLVIPAHNEEATIRETLQSVIAATAALTESCGEAFDTSITVILDGCVDGTSGAVEGFPLVKVIQHVDALGKWRSIQEACLAGKDTEWTILIDAGSSWRPDLLSAVACHLRDDSIVGIAPSYRNDNAGFLERLSWALERGLKSLENGAGGPISVHGATVFYRTPALCDAFSLLSGKIWLNDDVVIPLAIRSLFPSRKLIYLPTSVVNDISPIRTGSESTRRIRLVRGNLDWVQESFWHRSAVVRILALRRISRMTWAYWLMGLISPLLLFGFGGVVVFFLIIGLFTRNAAFNASLRAIHLLGKSQAVAWR